MTKDTFAIFQDNTTGLKYVKKVQDEMQKNHSECDGEIITGFMPEIKGDRMCPVRSFEMYLSLLNPRSNDLWQRPLARQNAEGECYCRKKVGHNPLSTFMSGLSKSCQLSQRYTNHDIRVTGCTILFRCQFTNKEIMAITGHKSVNSLAIYQKVSFDQKIRMGQTFNYALTDPERLQQMHPSLPTGHQDPLDITNAAELLAILNTDDDENVPPVVQNIPQQKQKSATKRAFQEINSNPENMQLVPIQAAPSTSAPPAPNHNPNVLNNEEMNTPNFDLLDFLADLSDDEMDDVALGRSNQMVPKGVNSVTQNTLVNKPTNAPNMPVFNNCKIGTININIVKK